jgi:hypothetical protein
MEQIPYLTFKPLSVVAAEVMLIQLEKTVVQAVAVAEEQMLEVLAYLAKVIMVALEQITQQTVLAVAVAELEVLAQAMVLVDQLVEQEQIHLYQAQP